MQTRDKILASYLQEKYSCALQLYKINLADFYGCCGELFNHLQTSILSGFTVALHGKKSLLFRARRAILFASSQSKRTGIAVKLDDEEVNSMIFLIGFPNDPV